MPIPAPTALDREELEELEEALELPPSDADDEPERDDDHDDDLSPDDEGGLDDSDAADLDVGGEDLASFEDGDDEDDRELDVGPDDDELQLHAGGEVEGEIEGLPDDDGIALDETGGDDDDGAEGTDDDPSDEVDESRLPAIDDDDGEADPDVLSEAILAEGASGLPAWAAARWVVADGAGAQVPCRAVAVAAGRVVAAGEVLLVVDEGARAARRLPFGEGAVAVALGGDALIAATARGQLLVSRDLRTSAASLGSWRAALGPSIGLWPAETGASAVELAATPGRFWIRAGAALLCATSLDKPPSPVRDRGVSAITATGGLLVALTVGADGPAIERFRGDDEGSVETPLAGAALKIAERDRGVLRVAAAGATCLALTDQRQIAVSRDAGATFTVLELGPVPAIAFAGDGADARLLALVAPTPGGAAYVVEIHASGEAARVGEIVPTEGEAPVEAASLWVGAALAWDASREVVWVACGVGLVALGRPQRH
jgi:hypothetical protein